MVKLVLPTGNQSLRARRGAVPSDAPTRPTCHAWTASLASSSPARRCRRSRACAARSPHAPPSPERERALARSWAEQPLRASGAAVGAGLAAIVAAVMQDNVRAHIAIDARGKLIVKIDRT